jgi:hypothetical protein
MSLLLTIVFIRGRLSGSSVTYTSCIATSTSDKLRSQRLRGGIEGRGFVHHLFPFLLSHSIPDYVHFIIIIFIIYHLYARYLQLQYVPETNRVPRVCSVAAILLLQQTCMVHVILFPMINVLYFTLVLSDVLVPNMVVFV